MSAPTGRPKERSGTTRSVKGAPTSAVREQGAVGDAAATARLRIEPLRAAHAAELFALLGDARLYCYMPGKPPRSVAALARLYARLQRGAPAGSNQVWLNWALRRIDGGCIGTLQATVIPGSHAHIAYVLSPRSWGHGFATEACRWLLAELPRRFVLDRLSATVDVRNAASIRVLERLGFRRVGSEASELRGEPTTDYQYRLTCGSAP